MVINTETGITLVKAHKLNSDFSISESEYRYFSLRDLSENLVYIQGIPGQVIAGEEYGIIGRFSGIERNGLLLQDSNYGKAGFAGSIVIERGNAVLSLDKYAIALLGTEEEVKAEYLRKRREKEIERQMEKQLGRFFG